nr:farnesyl pyrophosphate synthase [Pelodiscus sinensis]|eukprot:XP_014433520.2 farnesyl pyrophosphate synthase [Pelodiscus sinensis]
MGTRGLVGSQSASFPPCPPQVLEYNAPGGKYNRGLTLLAAFRELVEPERQDPESFQCALTVGWCIELLQACFLVADDIMDDSLTRRGQPCWDKQEGIGLDAVNDSFLLEACIYQLLKKYCRGRPYYLNLLELFLQTSYQTELGQALDLILLEENYGQKDAAKVAKVKELYEAVGMRAAYQECEESSYRRLEGLGLPRAIFLGLAQKIYKRQK